MRTRHRRWPKPKPFVRYVIPTPSGRQRFTVLGAIDALTKELITVVHETTVHAETMCQLLTKLAAHVADGPITVVLNNAHYQQCALVQGAAAVRGIALLYLPSCSPHLNLIERLWRFVRTECLYSHYYATFPAFWAARERCLTTAHEKRRIALKTLLSWNVQW